MKSNNILYTEENLFKLYKSISDKQDLNKIRNPDGNPDDYKIYEELFNFIDKMIENGNIEFTRLTTILHENTKDKLEDIKNMKTEDVYSLVISPN